MMAPTFEPAGYVSFVWRQDEQAQPQAGAPKQMTTGEGGIVTTDDADWAAQCRNLRNQGRGEMNEWLRHFRLGFNYRLNEMSIPLPPLREPLMIDENGFLPLIKGEVRWGLS